MKDKPSVAKGIKRLPPDVIRDVERKNHARLLVGLSPIRVTIRRCLVCGELFESAGTRTCGCYVKDR